MCEKRIINPQNLGQISSILVDYAIPSMILSSITGDGPHLSNSELVTVFGAVALTMALMLMVQAGTHVRRAGIQSVPHGVMA
ncbi:MAG TPA: hypothetical protein H9850_00185 [Candidatus Anaerobiospirillum pullistercoris]|uniref:Uncharacterized protein n=1 Tax=Candidatus Anaerobiospirillum pullistercoris TaxID=2838452 RepID=A0A9D1WB93_9GAMM|nr:hypothetical protein [Candidatus Anaerobiospirillum pullistercoris]